MARDGKLAAARCYISQAYDSIGWKIKVMNMPANQVMAIYHSMLKYNTVEKARKKAGMDKEYYQYTIFDILEGNICLK